MYVYVKKAQTYGPHGTGSGPLLTCVLVSGPDDSTLVLHFEILVPASPVQEAHLDAYRCEEAHRNESQRPLLARCCHMLHSPDVVPLCWLVE